MISTPLRMEKPVRRPIVPPIKPSAASVVTLGRTIEHLAAKFLIGKMQKWSFLPLIVQCACISVSYVLLCDKDHT